MDLDAVLNGATDTSTSKKKSNVPVMQVTSPQVQKLVTEFIDLKAKAATVDARLKDTAEEIIPIARDFHTEEMKGASKIAKTVKLQNPDGASVDVDVAKDQYRKISMDQQEDLQKTFGKEFPKMFEKVMEIGLTKAALADRDILTKLVKAVGEENFAKYFTVKSHLKPTSAFHEARFLGEGKVHDKVNDVVTEGIVEPYNPAVRA